MIRVAKRSSPKTWYSGGSESTDDFQGESRMVHTDRSKQMLVHVSREGLTANLLNHMSEQGITDVEIAENKPGRIGGIFLCECRRNLGKWCIRPHTLDKIGRES